MFYVMIKRNPQKEKKKRQNQAKIYYQQLELSKMMIRLQSRMTAGPKTVSVLDHPDTR